MNQNQRQWNTVAETGKRNTNRWEFAKYPLDVANNQPAIEGYYTDLIECPGQNGPFYVVEIHTLNGDGSLGAKWDISGGSVLEKEMAEIQMGSYVCIIFKGQIQGKKNKYNSWLIMKDDNAIPYQQLSGIAPKQHAVAAPAQPQQNQQQQAPVFQQPVQNTPVFNPPPSFNSTNQPPVQQPVQNTNTFTPPPQFNQSQPQQQPNPAAKPFTPAQQPAQQAAPVFSQPNPNAAGNGQQPGFGGTVLTQNPFADPNGPQF